MDFIMMKLAIRSDIVSADNLIANMKEPVIYS